MLPKLGEGKSLLLINDGSKLPETFQVLADALAHPRVRMFTRDEPHGFVASVNFGIRECPGQDVILLNSDTRVSAGFIERLRSTALQPSPLRHRDSDVKQRLDRLPAPAR